MGKRLLFCDLETYSEVPIARGTYAYAACPHLEVLLWAWAIDDGPVQVWDVTSGQAMPDALRACLDDADTMTVWHNGAAFDLPVLRAAMGIDIPDARVHDTLVQALEHSLPGALGTLSEIYGLGEDEGKDKDGRRLILRFCKPQPANQKIRRRTAETDPEDWARFVEYAARDIVAMRALMHKMPKVNVAHSRPIWELDQRVNRRGVRIDLALANAAQAAVAHAKRENRDAVIEATAGGVGAATQRDRLLQWILAVYGVDLPDLTKATLERRIEDPDLPLDVRNLLMLRQQASKASTAKYKAAVAAIPPGETRLRGALQFCGASRTGRWAGRKFQPQNMPRPTMKNADIAAGIDALLDGCADLVVPNVPELAANAVRGLLVAGPGRVLNVCDLSNIEGRTLAWVADETWKIEAFRDFDAGQGADLYLRSYASSFGVDVAEVTKDQRQIGKVQELALGYQGGVGAFVTFSVVYGIELQDLADKVLPRLPDDVVEKADWLRERALGQRPPHPAKDLTRDVFVACDGLKQLWRRAHPNVVNLWAQVQDAAYKVVAEPPGLVLEVGALRFDRKGTTLRIRLPSGRYLLYHRAAIRERRTPRKDGTVDVSDTLTYMGMDSYRRQWRRLHTYGGKLVENVVQAIACDVLREGMLEAERLGAEIVLTVHDEIISEDDAERFPDWSTLARAMTTVPGWCPGLPLAAGGFTDTRYRKD